MKTALANSWASFWDARNAREKTLITWGGVVLGVAIAYSVLWAPAQAGRAQLRETLPQMQRKLAAMTAQSDEARKLALAAQGVAPTGIALKNALAASLTDHGLSAAQVEVAGNAVEIQLKNASFPTWTMWVDDVRKQFKVQVSEAHITALKTDGQVDLNASLQPAASAGASR
ncbi:type II secretion system protein M [Trinickia terrae]|uniref:Type II secretion system protein M n=1 Tax=Trinickia terrae TaxID=2571161 RepID=A0A4U1HQ86_9BURK|nr:type II secretion system protein M [Trinickia terrae]TKC83512.1 type II secretion system protein M [Trinickia terrae]